MYFSKTPFSAQFGLFPTTHTPDLVHERVNKSSLGSDVLRVENTSIHILGNIYENPWSNE